MAEYIYDGGSIESPNSLYQALMTAGVYDAELTINGKIKIDTLIGTKEQCDQAMEAASKGSLYTNKSARIAEAQANSYKLLSEGWGFVRPSDGAYKGEFDLTEGTEGRLLRIKRIVEEGAATYPQLIVDVGGRGVELLSDEDQHAAQLAMDLRGVYILGDQVNESDASLGEGDLIKAIIAAEDQEALDKIVDKRK